MRGEGGFGHPAFFGGRLAAVRNSLAVAGTGEISIVNGKILWISNASGHYQPTETHLNLVVARLVHLSGKCCTCGY